jgi:hypothetical protein
MRERKGSEWNENEWRLYRILNKRREGKQIWNLKFGETLGEEKKSDGA